MIRVSNLSKGFKLYKSPVDRLKEAFFRKTYHQHFQALENVSFELEDGETLGIIGQNGSGKSTILKILTGITIPDAGGIQVDGRITGLLELGTGFNSELSGLQNIYLNGSLLGMKKEEIDSILETIVGFAELGHFIDRSLKLYSSGMVMRLAFAIAIHADPNCFVVDEALSVGDAYFQQKCVKKIKEFKEDGGSIVFVSHDMNAIKILCDKAILLEKGQVIEQGDPDSVINLYNYYLAKRYDEENKIQWDKSSNGSYGTFEIKAQSVNIVGDNSRSNTISSGELTHINLNLQSQIDFKGLTIGFDIRDRYGQIIYGTNTHHLGVKIDVRKNCCYNVVFTLPMNIGVGYYTLSYSLHSGKTHEDQCFEWADHLCKLEVTGIKGDFFLGLCKLEPAVQITEIENKNESQ